MATKPAAPGDGKVLTQVDQTKSTTKTTETASSMKPRFGGTGEIAAAEKTARKREEAPTSKVGASNDHQSLKKSSSEGEKASKKAIQVGQQRAASSASVRPQPSDSGAKPLNQPVVENGSSQPKKAPKEPVRVFLSSSDDDSDDNEALPVKVAMKKPQSGPTKQASGKADSVPMTDRKRSRTAETSVSDVQAIDQPPKKLPKLAPSAPNVASGSLASDGTAGKNTDVHSKKSRPREVAVGDNKRGKATPKQVTDEKSIPKKSGGGKGAIIVPSLERTGAKRPDHLQVASTDSSARKNGSMRKRQLEETKSEEQQDRVFRFAKKFFEESPKESTTVHQIISRIETELGVLFPLHRKKEIIAYLKELSTEWVKKNKLRRSHG
jgi:hypothetical protein